MKPLQELLPLLSRGKLRGAAAVRRIEQAADGPDFEWAEDPAQALMLALCDALDGQLIETDKLDDLHQQLSTAVDGGLPPFPQKRYAAAKRSRFAYFEWLDEQLAEHRLALMSLEPCIDDQERVLLVDRNEIDRIGALAAALDLLISYEDGAIPDFLARR